MSGLLYACSDVVNTEVGEQFISARSASWSASNGEGAPKEKSRKRFAMAVVSERPLVLSCEVYPVVEAVGDQQRCPTAKCRRPW